mmetsp:Transcript_17917/g.62895  ORF Transcript_17917/g.62895 Transcript_17917/m.62895 type:complete len:457 (+) Transcript_17917:140-1510(+)
MVNCSLCSMPEPDININGLGIKTAFKYLSQYKTPERMIRCMAKEKRWQGKLPCPIDEYMQRYRCIVAVFWHHTVFDPKLGECVSIAAAFPESDRALEAIDLRAICGEFHPKEFASRIAKGEIDARTHVPRPQEPFTPAERACIERILATKREKQRDHNFRLSLQEDAQRIREAADAKATEVHATAPPSSAAVAASASSAVPAASAAPGGAEGDDDDDEAEERAPREMYLLKGEMKSIRGVMEEVFDSVHARQDEGSLETPPRPSAPPSENSWPSARTPALGKVNPFARKRTANAVDLTGTSAAMADVPKRARLNFNPAVAALKRPAVVADAGLEEPTEVRHLLQPEVRKRGGYAAADAARTVLTHLRGAELEALSDARDRNKLTAFFKVLGQRKEAPAAPPKEEPKKSYLAEWNPRPWEKEEEPDPFALGYNPLSMKTARNGAVFRTMGNWESGGI